jgi:hypothetical protein
MNHDLPPVDDALDIILEAAKECAVATSLPRQAVLDVCPVCSRPVIVRNGHAICVSAMCRERVIEGCCGE